MQDLTAGYFFDLTNYQHRALFEKDKPVWEALVQLEKYLATLALGKIEAEIPQGVYLVDPHLISIGHGSIIEPGAYIKGPCYIGRNCTVRHGAYVRGNLITGDKCVIGHDTEIKHTILLNESHAPHFAYVGDSILGNRVNLGAGTICANLKLDRLPIRISVGELQMESGLRKFGAIFGDDTQTGCNSVMNPGTLLGKGVWCYPTLNIGGFVPSNSVIKREENLSKTVRTKK